ncbi:hypothetical protein Tsubulata_009613 [Turnera subulata]|uniref:Uncharacterized protein n=1 Tax=Turnera subulata TaxID=218843 RepID=A0A9Q0F160_9ROSI|nr:hypothetical protein Tsubulata_009613 [Turnera subulata]
MQRVLSNARRFTASRSLKPPPSLLPSSSSSTDSPIATAPHSCPHQCQHLHTFSSTIHRPGTALNSRRILTASFSTEAAAAASPLETAPSEAVKEFYDKIMDSVKVKRTMAPNAWLWSLIENCQNKEDIKLLFDTLHNLRIFRLSNLRIHENFNCNLCREVTKACARVGAVEFGKKALWKHNVYGLDPSVASANHLLTYAKTHNDLKLMVEVMQLLKRNNVPLQPSTADLVFSSCCNSDNWGLISKYARRFLEQGVKLHKTAYDLWMDFAAKRGDTESLWKIEKLRSESVKQHSVLSGFSCAKGLILESKPEDAATLIQLLYQTLSDKQKSNIVVQLQKLVNEWPQDVIRYQPEERRQATAAALKSGIPAMVTSLLNMGLEANVNLDELSSKELC